MLRTLQLIYDLSSNSNSYPVWHSYVSLCTSYKGMIILRIFYQSRNKYCNICLYFLFETAIKARGFFRKWLVKQASLMKLTCSFDIRSIFYNCLSELEANKSFLSCQLTISYDTASCFMNKCLKRKHSV